MVVYNGLEPVFALCSCEENIASLEEVQGEQQIMCEIGCVRSRVEHQIPENEKSHFNAAGVPIRSTGKWLS